MTLSLVCEGITIAVPHEANWLNIELRAAEKLPVTQTGYRSHFIPHTELAPFAGLENFVLKWLNEAALSRAWQQHLKDS